MSKYINKNALAEKILVREALIKEERNADYENLETYNGMIRGLVEAQRLMLETDTIEIVRCKDCKYYTHYKWIDIVTNEAIEGCRCDKDIISNTIDVNPDDYCSYAEQGG